MVTWAAEQQTQPESIPEARARHQGRERPKIELAFCTLHRMHAACFEMHAACFERLSQLFCCKRGFRNHFVAGKQIVSFRHHFVAGKQLQQPVIFEIWAAPGLAEIARMTSEALRARFSSERSPEFPGAAQLTNGRFL